MKLNPEFSVITCMPFGYFTCVLRARFKEVLQVDVFLIIIYSLIKKNDVIKKYRLG